MSIIDNDVKILLQTLDLTKLKNKSILITGASGLIGIYLSNCLKQIQKEYNITVYLWIHNKIESIFKENYAFDNKIYDYNMSVDKYYETYFPAFDYIIHAAGYGQPNKFSKNKNTTIELNTSITLKLFKLLKKTGTFLFLSTSELYSGLDLYSIDENNIGTTNTNHPRACYIEGKRCGETICYNFAEQGYNIKIARISLAYGAGTKINDDRVINQLIQKAIQQNTIKLLDDGSAIRTYCYIRDNIEMLWNILLNSESIVYNVGGISTLSILNLANMIGEYFNIPVEKGNNILTSAPKIVNINIDKYCSEFNKKTFVDFETGLKNTIEWQKIIYKN